MEVDMSRFSQSLKASLVLGALLVGPVACSDTDGDGNPEIEAPDFTTPDLDPGAGEGAPGDSGDEAPGDNPDAPDADPGAGDGAPGDADDQ